MRGVHDLGVELDSVEAALGVLDRRDRRFARGSQCGEARRRLEDGVAMAHPAGLLGRQPGEQGSGLDHGQPRATELADLSRLDPSAERQHHRLHAVTDAEHRNAELEQLAVASAAPLRSRPTPARRRGSDRVGCAA